jgi:hypothetical protein
LLLLSWIAVIDQHRRGGARAGGNGDHNQVIHQVVRETSSEQYSLLMKTNYYSWAGMLRLKL